MNRPFDPVTYPPGVVRATAQPKRRRVLPPIACPSAANRTHIREQAEGVRSTDTQFRVGRRFKSTVSNPTILASRIWSDSALPPERATHRLPPRLNAIVNLDP
jgi:hypothetical protein